MNKDDLNELVTKKDLETLKKELKDIILDKVSPSKIFVSPKEFSAKTGIPYTSVIDKCYKGKLKAYQESPKGSWLINASEIDRLLNEANNNQF